MLKDHVLNIEQAKKLKDDILNNLDSPELFDVPIEFYWLSIKGEEKYKLVDIDDMIYHEEHCNYFDDEFDYYPALTSDELISILLPDDIDWEFGKYNLNMKRSYDCLEECYTWHTSYVDDIYEIFIEYKNINLLDSLVGLYKEYKNIKYDRRN